jgi:hypothetical protein
MITVIKKRISSSWLRSQAVVLFLSLLAFGVANLSAEVPEKLELFLENHCMDCHDDDLSKGGLNFLSLTWQP